MLDEKDAIINNYKNKYDNTSLQEAKNKQELAEAQCEFFQQKWQNLKNEYDTAITQ